MQMPKRKLLIVFKWLHGHDGVLDKCLSIFSSCLLVVVCRPLRNGSPRTSKNRYCRVWTSPIPSFSLSTLHRYFMAALLLCLLRKEGSSTVEIRTRGQKVSGSSPCTSGGRVYLSRVSFLCWLLLRYPFHPRVTAVAHKRSGSFCQKCRWQLYS